MRIFLFASFAAGTGLTLATRALPTSSLGWYLLGLLLGAALGATLARRCT